MILAAWQFFVRPQAWLSPYKKAGKERPARGARPLKPYPGRQVKTVFKERAQFAL